MSLAFLGPGVLPFFFLTAGVTLLALLPPGVAFLPTLDPRPLAFLGVFLAELLTLEEDRPLPGELPLESGELTLLLGVEDRSLVLAPLFRDVLGVTSSSSSSSLGGRLFFLVLLVDMVMLLCLSSWGLQGNPQHGLQRLDGPETW